jgi:hypothetical protein
MKELKCEKCGEPHNGCFGSGRFCSRFCANAREWSKKKKDKHKLIMKNSTNVLNANKFRISRVKNVCVMCKKEFEVHKYRSDSKFCSKKCFYSDKDFKFRRKSKGGVREGSGHGKSGWYKGIQCDSSYELAWVIYNLEHGVNFIRNKKGFEYFFDGKKHNYYPDYYLPDKDEYVEIKGFKTKQNESKIEQFKYKISTLYKKDLTDIFNYVINKYGRNFIELYEGNPHKLRKNKCGICGKPSKKKYCSRICSGKAVIESGSDKKLNNKQINEINVLYTKGLTQKLIGEKFGVSQSTISEIINKKVL